MESSKTHGRAHVLVGAILQAMLVVGLATNAGAQQWVSLVGIVPAWTVAGRRDNHERHHPAGRAVDNRRRPGAHAD